jgi:hypothetical protein
MSSSRSYLRQFRLDVAFWIDANHCDVGPLCRLFGVDRKWVRRDQTDAIGFGKQDFVYLSNEDAYRCLAGKKLIYHCTNEEDGQQLRRYWTNECRGCALKASCTNGKERRITRWEHEHVLEDAQRRLDNNPHAVRQRRETVEHPFGTIKARMGATHFLTKTLPKVATEMALTVLAYNLTGL